MVPVNINPALGDVNLNWEESIMFALMHHSDDYTLLILSPSIVFVYLN
jgi:hypothetical protein